MEPSRLTGVLGHHRGDDEDEQEGGGETDDGQITHGLVPLS
jgi:hypothetical protein